MTAWYTPAYFSGRVLVNRRTGTVDHFRLGLAGDKALNVHLTVEAKGIAEPLVLHELHALRGRFAQRLPEAATDDDPQVDVALPFEGWVIDGKVVSKEGLGGVVRRLGVRQLDVELAATLPSLANLKLRLAYPGLGYGSGDLYGKVVGREEREGTRQS